MYVLLILRLVRRLGPINRFHHTSLVTVVTPTKHTKSDRSRRVFNLLLLYFMLSLDFIIFCSNTDGIGDFIIRLSQISFFFSFLFLYIYLYLEMKFSLRSLFIGVFIKEMTVIIFRWMEVYPEKKLTVHLVMRVAHDVMCIVHFLGV